jgi:7-alpha-hydroxysteroid dehydrogenase
MILDRFRLTDKVAIVTGAGRGIGRGIAEAFAEVGAHVVCAARTQEQIDQAAETVRGFGRRALAVPCDVNDRSQLEKLVAQTMDEFGRIDILVNNAGGALPTPALKTSESAFEEAFRFNVTSAFLLSRFSIPHMKEGDGGTIINISSAMGHLVGAGFVAYATAKAALDHMTRILADEFAPRVRVNTIAPGSIETEALGLFVADENIRKQMEALTPMRCLGTVEDIALGAIYLASPAGRWVTGKIFEIDGGTVVPNWPFNMRED